MNFIAKSAGNTDSNIAFWTEAVGGSPTEKLRITSDGNVLLSKTSTSDYGRFEVKGPTADNIDTTSDIRTKTVATFSGSTPGTTAAGREWVLLLNLLPIEEVIISLVLQTIVQTKKHTEGL